MVVKRTLDGVKQGTFKKQKEAEAREAEAEFEPASKVI